MRLDKNVWILGLWKNWISSKEMENSANKISNPADKQMYENAIKMLKWSKRIIVLVLVATVIHSMLNN